MRAPAVDHARDPARFERIDPDLVEIAELTWLELRRERRRDVNVALQFYFELPDIGGPALKLCRLFAQAGAGAEIVIRPDMDHPVERADFGVPEGGER